MSLLDSKRKVDGYGDPEFFTLGSDIDDQRVRRNDVVSYKTIKEGKEYCIKLKMRDGNNIGYTTSDIEIVKITLEKLDRLFNVKRIR